MSSRLAIALLTTLTSPWPAAWIFLRSTEAPMAEEPMPASQAKTIERISLPAVAAPVRAPATEDFLPLLASMLRRGGREVVLVVALLQS